MKKVFLIAFSSFLMLAHIYSDQAVVFSAMEKEMARSMKKLKLKGSPKPYYMHYLVQDIDKYRLTSSYGVINMERQYKDRYALVSIRIGSDKLDQTMHPADKPYDPSRYHYLSKVRTVNIPLENDEEALRNSLWLLTDLKFKQAIKEYSKKQAKLKKEVTPSEDIQDFSREKPEISLQAPVEFTVNKKYWEKKLKSYSKIFLEYPEIDQGQVSIIIEGRNTCFLSSEGSKVSHGLIRYRISVRASTVSEDGMRLSNFVSFEGWKEDDLPGDEKITSEIRRILNELTEIKDSDVIEPFSGPILLKGAAASVFFHEVFGHRMEGHRQKSKHEAETFKNKIGEIILPEYVSIYDDPTIKYYGGKPIYGYYAFDEEGIRSQKVTLVANGVLKNFLMSRMPIKGFAHSNGHGRLQIERGWRKDLVPRQGNLVIESSETIEESNLENRLIEECKKQGKPYGLIITATSGGATMTGRSWIQSFVQIPLVIYKLYIDGTKEMVKGARFGGTPLVSFEKILCFGDVPFVFNGYCGAESGSIPVSAVSPSVIISSLEIQKESTAKLKPLVLESPVKESQRRKK